MAERHAIADDEECPPTKKTKFSDEEKLAENASEENTSSTANGKEPSGKDDGAPETHLNLSAFQVTKVLQNNCSRKLICLEGKFEDREGPAVILLEQKSFPYDTAVLKENFFDAKTIFRKYFSNDIYGKYNCFPAGECNGKSIFG